MDPTQPSSRVLASQVQDQDKIDPISDHTWGVEKRKGGDRLPKTTKKLPQINEDEPIQLDNFDSDHEGS